jgi:hypothetical protein
MAEAADPTSEALRPRNAIVEHLLRDRDAAGGARSRRRRGLAHRKKRPEVLVHRCPNRFSKLQAGAVVVAPHRQQLPDQLGPPDRSRATLQTPVFQEILDGA